MTDTTEMTLRGQLISVIVQNWALNHVLEPKLLLDELHKHLNFYITIESSAIPTMFTAYYRDENNVMEEYTFDIRVCPA